MSTSGELIGVHAMRAIRQNFPGVLGKCAGLFWTDDDSNYAGAFLAPPLLGRVFFLKHDGLSYTPPRLRSVESFCRSMLAAAEQYRFWFDMATDYRSEHRQSITLLRSSPQLQRT